MPEIEITEAQHEYLQTLREDIQQEVAGPYAHVRTVDALQYLIDNHEGDIDATVAAASAEPAAGEGGPAGGDEAPVGDASAGATPDDGAASSDAEDEPAADEDAASDDGAGAAPMAAAGGAADDDGMLSAMMQLLDTHDDRWQKVEGDTGYEVELPDGGTETVGTKDDVRALLYQHYE